MQEYEHHALQAVRLAQHLRSLNTTVIWVDYNPTSFGAHGKPILQCLLHINGVGHAQVPLHPPSILLCHEQGRLASVGAQRFNSGNMVLWTDIHLEVLAALACVLEVVRSCEPCQE